MDDEAFKQTADAIARHPASKYNYDEHTICEMFGFEGGVKELNGFVDRLKKGGTGGNKRSRDWKRNPEPYHVPIDVKDIHADNPLHFHRCVIGQKSGTSVNISVPGTDVLMPRKRTLYSFGRHGNEHEIMCPEYQQVISKAVTGEHSDSLDHVKERRQEQYELCFENKPGAEDYIKLDLPQFAIDYGHMLGVSFDDNDVEIEPEVLDIVKEEIATLLQCSYVLPSKSVMSSTEESATEDDENTEDEDEDEDNDTEVDDLCPPMLGMLMRETEASDESGDESDDESDDVGDEGDEYPSDECDEDDNEWERSPRKKKRKERRGTTKDGSMFDYGLLRKQWFNEGSEMQKEVGRKEIALDGARSKLHISIVNHTIRELGGTIYEEEEYKKIVNLTPQAKTRYSYNFKWLKKEIESATPSWHPFALLRKEQMLLQWVSDASEYYDTGQVIHKMYVKGDTAAEMSMATAVVIRHIIFSYNLSLSSFPAMLVCFAVLILGRTLNPKEFFSVRTVRNHIMKLSYIDDYLMGKKYDKVFNRAHRYGFKRRYYLTTDGTKHGKHDDKHVAMRSGDKGFEGEEDDGFKINPFFDCLSTGQSVAKDNKQNALHNIEVLLENSLTLETFASCGGSTTDNAAREETKLTYKYWKEHLETEGREELTMAYGVEVLWIAHMDPFHCCNLAIQHSSEKGLGKTDRNNMREEHHRQLQQTFHDVHICDPAMAQQLADEVVAKYSTEEVRYIIKTMRERLQRWLVNGRNAKYLLQGFDLDLRDPETGDKVNFWVEWARRYHDLCTGWKKTALEEIMQWCQMPEMVIALQFEAELVDYFEVTYQWHAYPGELCDRPGFRTMELHHLLFEFIMPFWESARQNPEARFPKTYGRIEALEKEAESIDEVDEDLCQILSEKAEMKRDQIMFGIQAGYDEISKLYQRLLKAPMIFLAVMDPEVGPTILRAILAVIHEDIDINQATTEYDDAGVDYGVNVDPNLEWGDFTYDDEDDRPDEEQDWYEWLLEDKEALVMCYQQLGLCRAVVLNDLKRLSQETHNTRSKDANRLHDFFTEFKVLFTALHAVYALLPSASRIVESAHGIMRECYDPQIPTAFMNAKMRYLINKGYNMKEARRKIVRALAAKASVSSKKKRRTVKATDRKLTMAMQGSQLEDLVKEYEDLEELPALLKKKIQIQNINKSKADIKERMLLSQKKDEADKTREKRKKTREPVDMDKVRDTALRARTPHDEGWDQQDEREVMQLIKQMLTKTYWKDKVPTPMMKTDIFRVFPEFESPAAWEVGKTRMMQPTGEKFDFGAHTELIKKIAKKEVENTLNDTDLSNLTENDILKMFVRYDRSVAHESAAENDRTDKAKLQKIFKIFGTTPSTRKRFTAESTYARGESRLNRADEEGDEDLWGSSN